MKQLVILMFAAAVAGSAVAGDTKESGMLESEAEFISLDADQNGALSKDEASLDQKLVENFAAADADQDGEISKAEYILYSGDATAAGG
jgi:hypothetical protein